ncbi:MAG: hypothetical protein HYW48_09210, partial [Deltaproteobacteria bacterium]|nr:hypothetical protein [Deltaproteobacteria bacterium]
MPELWIKSKIRNIYALKGVYSVWLLLEFMEGIFWAFWLVNVSDQKLTFFHICLALASFKLICFFLEKPTGRLADVFGRKLVTCTGILLLSLGFFMYAFAELKPLLYVSLSVAALGWTCLNGAKQAWFLNRGNDVIANFDSRFFFIDLEFSRRLALILGAIVGKTANAISYKHPWYLVGIAGMLTLAIA